MKKIVNTNFTQISNKVIKNPKITPYAKTVYLVLKSFSPSFPSYKRIMELTGINSRSTISNCLQILVKAEVLRIVQDSSHRSNLYEFSEIDTTRPITGLELVHEVDTNNTNVIIPNNNINGSPAPPKGDVEPLDSSKIFDEAKKSLGNEGKYGYKEKPRLAFIVEPVGNIT